MGYTHYWDASNKPIPSELVDAANKILAKAHERGIRLAFEYDHPSSPPVANSKIIRFNGLGSEGHETFCFEADGDFAFCKTNGKPYDVVVVAMLATIAHFALAEVRSDGDAPEWQAGVTLAREATGLNVRVPASVGTASVGTAEDNNGIEELIEAQGWNETTVNDLLFRFIGETGQTDGLHDFLRRIANEENRG